VTVTLRFNEGQACDAVLRFLEARDGAQRQRERQNALATKVGVEGALQIAERKPVLHRSEDPEARKRTAENHQQIGHAIDEASHALSSQGISISRDHHYQLSNRIAMAWKLASLGIPCTLVFLGFTGDREISREGNYFSDDDQWRRAFADYLEGVLPINLLENDISSGTASFRVLSRSLPAIRCSRPIAERKGRRPQ
jgi:hypothetical protein